MHNYTDFVPKACPVVLRKRNGTWEILAFQHPYAGKQIAKGTIDSGEDPAEAAVRELFEETGISDAQIERFITTIYFEAEKQSWHVFFCQTAELPEEWSHEALEGDGNRYLFRFFWHPLEEVAGDDWHYTFSNVLDLVREEIFRAE